jgi:DnaK suppressor protein
VSLHGFVKHAVEMAEPSDRRPEGHVGVDLQAVAQRLRREQAEVSTRLRAMTDDLQAVFATSVDSNADDEHDPEGQTIAYERAQLSALIDASQEHLSDIETAVTRLEQGIYGICDVCLQPIPTARLDARPTAQTCVEHAVSEATRRI